VGWVGSWVWVVLRRAGWVWVGVGGLPTKPPWAGLGHPMQSSLPTLTVRISHLPGQGIYQRTPSFHGPLTVSEASRPWSGPRTHRVLGSSPSAPTVVVDTKEGRAGRSCRKADREADPKERPTELVGGGEGERPSFAECPRPYGCHSSHDWDRHLSRAVAEPSSPAGTRRLDNDTDRPNVTVEA
jgi:hypothetical protein